MMSSPPLCLLSSSRIPSRLLMFSIPSRLFHPLSFDSPLSTTIISHASREGLSSLVTRHLYSSLVFALVIDLFPNIVIVYQVYSAKHLPSLDLQASSFKTSLGRGLPYSSTTISLRTVGTREAETHLAVLRLRYLLMLYFTSIPPSQDVKEAHHYPSPSSPPVFRDSM